MDVKELEFKLVSLCTEVVNDTDKRDEAMEELININFESILDPELLNKLLFIMLNNDIVYSVMREIQVYAIDFMKNHNM